MSSGQNMQWSSAVHCGRDFSPHSVVFQCASMNASALRGHIQLTVLTMDPGSIFLYRLRVTDTNTILFTKNFGLLHAQLSRDAREDADNDVGLTSRSSRRATSSESPAFTTIGSSQEGSPKVSAVGRSAIERGTRELSEIVFATAKRELAPRVELGKIRLQVILLRTIEERAEAQRCIKAKEWQTLNKLFSAVEALGDGQGQVLQTFNLSCEVDPVVGAAGSVSSSLYGSRGSSTAPPDPPANLMSHVRCLGAADSVDSSLNTPRSAASSSSGPAVMFGAGALVGATAALVFGRYAQHSK